MDRKVAGIPLPVIGAVLGLLMVGMIYLRSRKSAATAATTTYPDINTDPTNTNDNSGASDASAVTSYATNTLWEAAAVTYLTTQGNSPLTVERALEDYMNGETLDSSEQTIVNAAIIKFGLPPQGLAAPVTTSDSSTTKTPSTSTTTPETQVTPVTPVTPTVNPNNPLPAPTNPLTITYASADNGAIIPTGLGYNLKYDIVHGLSAQEAFDLSKELNPSQLADIRTTLLKQGF